MFSWKVAGIVERLILAVVLLFLFQTPFAVAKFGEPPPVKGQVKCCFGKGGGFLSGRCLEMLEKECALKRGVVVKDCKECEGREGDKGKRRCCVPHVNSVNVARIWDQSCLHGVH